MRRKGRKRAQERTLARHEERFPASWRARPRKRSYSASVEEDEGWWLKAIPVSELDFSVKGAGNRERRTAATQLGHWVRHVVATVKTVVIEIQIMLDRDRKGTIGALMRRSVSGRGG